MISLRTKTKREISFTNINIDFTTCSLFKISTPVDNLVQQENGESPKKQEQMSEIVTYITIVNLSLINMKVKL